MSIWETFPCPRCNRSSEVRIDLSLDRPLVIHCPECGHEQTYVIKDGRRRGPEGTPWAGRGADG